MRISSGPRHLEARRFLQAGLFDGVRSLADLESRISQLPGPSKVKGDAFEVFAEAYLVTQGHGTEVWPLSSVPPDLLRALALRREDKGVDGVYRTPLGEHYAYQAKFRSRRDTLTWSDISTFLGLADRADHRVLLTNAADVAAVARERTNFFVIRHADLERLEPRDFEAIRVWLRTGTYEPERKTPHPHQEEALEALLETLRDHDRATAIMACGTGKTLVTLWLAERMQCREVLVLVPSLALVRQSLHEWHRETAAPNFAYCCVCSDVGVAQGVDTFDIRQSDLDFPVTTEARTVRRFLDQPFDGLRVVFSTYQSAQVVGEALAGEDPFDLGIFDEAHKTAGRQGTKFGFALSDDRLPIRKRVFLTATPRHYQLNRRTKDGDHVLAYSMDDPDVYGPRAHTLTFAEAAKRDIICNYKVLASVVTSTEVRDELLRRGEVIVEGDAIQARHVAQQLAVKRAVEQCGAKHIFTFHGRVKAAASFVAPGGEGISAHLPEFAAFHVNGNQPTREREAILREFAEADAGVVSNARCLTEGVDLPAVDMVAFMAPKKSKVDIVQATGRAMRKGTAGSQKMCGYVLVPIFVEQAAGESVDSALHRSDYADLMDVLNAMQDQDEDLVDIIRELNGQRGERVDVDTDRFREKVEVLGPLVHLETLRNAITADVIEKIAETWDFRFGELKAFKEREGHCNVPREYGANAQLGWWVGVQRQYKRKKILPADRQERLASLGFTWNTRDSVWEQRIAELIAFRNEFGHCNVPFNYVENPQLGHWLDFQRQRKKRRGTKHKSRLSPERVGELEAVGVVWDTRDAGWNRSIADLIAFRDKHGHCNVPKDYEENPFLGEFIDRNRQRYRRGSLSQERANELERIGAIWDPRAARWEEMFAALVRFKDKYGHCYVPFHYQEDRRLGRWVQKQRTLRRQPGKLSRERETRLQELGVDWNPGVGPS